MFIPLPLLRSSLRERLNPFIIVPQEKRNKKTSVFTDNKNKLL